MRRLATLVLVTTLAAPSTALAQTTGSDVVEAVAVGIGISVGTAFSVVTAQRWAGASRASSSAPSPR